MAKWELVGFVDEQREADPWVHKIMKLASVKQHEMKSTTTY
jgi:hypothetical protein